MFPGRGINASYKNETKEATRHQGQFTGKLLPKSRENDICSRSIAYVKRAENSTDLMVRNNRERNSVSK